MMAVFDNLPNFRPAGGYGLTNKRGQRVKEGLLYRSSRTDSITLKDRSLLLQLGIKSTVDIRGEKNYRRLTSKPLQDLYTPCVIRNGERCSVSKQVKKHGEREAVGFNYLFDIYTHQLSRHIFNQANIFLRLFSFVFILPIDLLLGTCLMSYLFGRFVVRYLSLSRQYIDYLEFGKPVIAEMMNLLLSPQQNLPMLIHCAYGKDRTGLMIALILDCIEVDDDAIIQDYTQSEEGLAPMREQMYHEIINDWRLLEEHCLSRPETMKEVLQELRKRYGSTSQYLESIGFTLENQYQLKSILLET